MFGTEDLHAYVRLMAALEIVENGKYYDIKLPTFSFDDN